jgi:hypothetical protein
MQIKGAAKTARNRIDEKFRVSYANDQEQMMKSVPLEALFRPKQQEEAIK